MPPTSAAATFHSMRALLQCQCWIGAGDGLNPNDWGWYTLDIKLLPLKTKLPAAPEELLKMIRCQPVNPRDVRAGNMDWTVLLHALTVRVSVVQIHQG